MGRCFLGALRSHLGWVRRAGNAARPKQLALDVIFGFLRLNPVERSFSGHPSILRPYNPKSTQTSHRDSSATCAPNIIEVSSG
jgi:hypothetical protein